MSGLIRKIFTGFSASAGDSPRISKSYHGSLYKCNGKTYQLVLKSCCMNIEDDIIMSGVNPNDNQKENYIFNFKNIHYFHSNKQGEFIIITRSGQDLVKFVFEFENMDLHILSFLSYNITLSLRSLCSIKDQIPIELYEHDDTITKKKRDSILSFNAEEWKPISLNAICELLSSKDFKDTIFSIKNLSGKGEVLFASIIGDNILFLPKLSERVVEFYGFNQDEIRKRYRIHFKRIQNEGEDNSKSFYSSEEEIDGFIAKLLEHIDQVNPEEKRPRKSVSEIIKNEVSDYGVSYKMDLDDNYNPSKDQIMWECSDNESDRTCSADEVENKCYSTPRRVTKNNELYLNHKYMLIGHENTFVGRANRRNGKSEIAVFKNTESEGSNYNISGTPARNISVIKNIEFENQSVLPVGGQLHNCETQMLFLSETDPNYVYQMDLTNEKILRRWDANGLPISCLGLSSKDSQSTPVPTFLGLSNSAMFIMDSRIKESSNRFTSKIYRSNVLFSSMATDKDGHILIGNDLGELRLYDGTMNKDGEFKKAKTLLNSFGSPIISVDVTRNGNWILATTKNCIHLYPVTEQEENSGSEGRNGFVSSLRNKPPSRKLRLKPEDLFHYKITEVNFTPARFDQCQGPEGFWAETKIVTSIDNFVIVWDFEAVKRGNLYSYSIKEVESRVEDCSTFYNNSDSVVLAYKDDLKIHKLNRKNKRNIYSR
ncbi:Vacuolar import/degradation Vid27-related protein [Cryptosporidium hominis]|uniref:Vacuolar import/degradation Vid27-related protein n=2 Tax=Cryptosporidium hominis TaxID=237895 RepID=A0ABX5BE18_CRYHO|nr:Vacuolar import/degradation Vid27-related protein [Cryptosporidium hominis]|eukprot:PPS96365.1 Vacuolar import/degradation Vid27-related protein [Cryptosporidium hominis]